MPAHKRPGKKPNRPKLEIRATYEWLDLIARAAAHWEQGASEYVRKATQRQLVADGFASPEEGPDPGKPTTTAPAKKRKGKP